MGILFGKPATPEDMSNAKQVVDQAIAGNRVVVFSKEYCPYCTKVTIMDRDIHIVSRLAHLFCSPAPPLPPSPQAKRALASVGLPKEKIVVIELDQRGDGDAIQDYLQKLTGGRSVPRVFIDEAFIGGGDDTDALARSGKLEIMLREKGIM